MTNTPHILNTENLKIHDIENKWMLNLSNDIGIFIEHKLSFAKFKKSYENNGPHYYVDSFNKIHKDNVYWKQFVMIVPDAFENAKCH